MLSLLCSVVLAITLTHSLNTGVGNGDKKANRIYINNSLPERSWNTGAAHKLTDQHGVKLENSDNFDEDEPVNQLSKNEEFITKKYTNKKDIIIIKKTNTSGNELIKHTNNSNKSNTFLEHVLGTGMKRTQFLNEHREPIEILDLSNLENIYKVKQSGVGSVATTDNFQSKIKPGPITRPTTAKNNRKIITTSTKPTPLDSVTEEQDNNAFELSKTKSAKVDQHIDPTTHSISMYPHTGQVKRVYINESKTRRRTTLSPENNNYKTNKLSTVMEDFTTEHNNETINSVRSDFKLLLPEDTSIKSSLNRKTNVRYETASPDDIMLEEILNDEAAKLDITVHKVANIGTVKKVPHPTEDSRGNEPTFESETLASGSESILDGTTETFHSVTEEMPVLTTITFKPTLTVPLRKQTEINTQIERYQSHNTYSPMKPSSQPIPEFVTKGDGISNHHLEYQNQYRLTSQNIFKRMKTTTNPPKVGTIIKKHITYLKDDLTQVPEEKDEVVETEDNVLDNNRNSNTMQNLIKFLKTVTDIISRNTRRGIHGKVQYLEDLRDTLLANIEERIEMAFPSEMDRPAAARRRALRRRRATPALPAPALAPAPAPTPGPSAAQARGSHVEFPSSESALMTISFLTFAVFLIKLILQVIQAYKNKAMMVMPTMVAAVGRGFAGGRSAY